MGRATQPYEKAATISSKHLIYLSNPCRSIYPINYVTRINLIGFLYFSLVSFLRQTHVIDVGNQRSVSFHLPTVCNLPKLLTHFPRQANPIYNPISSENLQNTGLRNLLATFPPLAIQFSSLSLSHSVVDQLLSILDFFFLTFSYFF